MNILSNEAIKNLPLLYSQEYVEDPIVPCRIYHPFSDWFWFPLEKSVDAVLTWYPLNDTVQRQERISDYESQTLCSLWYKSGTPTLPFSIGEDDLRQFMQEQASNKNTQDSLSNWGEEQSVEGRSDAVKRVHIPVSTESSPCPPEEVCEEGDVGSRTDDRSLSGTKRTGASQERGQAGRQTRESRVDDSKPTHEASYASPNTERQIGKVSEILDFVFFGYVRGFEGELGYFSVAEFKETEERTGVSFVVDETFTPMKLSQVKLLPNRQMSDEGVVVIFIV